MSQRLLNPDASSRLESAPQYAHGAHFRGEAQAFEGSDAFWVEFTIPAEDARFTLELEVVPQAGDAITIQGRRYQVARHKVLLGSGPVKRARLTLRHVPSVRPSPR